MDLGLHGKVAIVTGSSRGIGKDIAAGLVREGCQVVLCARGAAELERAAAELGTPAQAVTLAADVTEALTADALVATAVRAFGRLDIVVNNAGGNRRKPFAETTDADWRDLYELNVVSGMRLTRAALPALRKHDQTAVLFIASLFGREAGGPGLALYNATKAAQISAAKILALELAPEGIRVNSLAPGSIRFPGSSWDKRVAADPEGMQRFVADNLPLGRFGTVEEVAAAAVFLVSPAASLITGACIAVDGAQGRSLI
jgi:3-oxoacyl-[acyl-carrier protein] reductase